MLLAAGVLPTSGWAVPEDAEQPIHIRADSAEIDEVRGLAIYRGGVRMDQGTLRVTADTMTIELADERVVKITAEGDRAHYQQRLEHDASEVVANARTIIYFTQEERVELIGMAQLSQEGNEFSGEVIRYDMRAGKVDARSQTGGGVKMVLQPAKPDQ